MRSSSSSRRDQVSPTPQRAPTARPIPAWGVAPRTPTPTTRGLKARPIPPSIPKIRLVRIHPILLQKRTQLILKPVFPVMRLLRINVTNQRLQIGRPNGKRTISSLPRKFAQPRKLPLQPFGRRRLHLSHQIRDVRRRTQPHRKMNMIFDATYPIALASRPTHDRCKIGVEPGTHTLIQQRRSIFRTEDHVNHNKRQRTRHGAKYRSN